jgi:hypothetical protein
MNDFVLIIIYLTLYFREDLSKMEYLGCCLKEALRLHSPVPFIMRQITKEVEIEGIKFPVELVLLSICIIYITTHMYGKTPWNTDQSDAYMKTLNRKIHLPLFPFLQDQGKYVFNEKGQIDNVSRLPSQ